MTIVLRDIDRLSSRVFYSKRAEWYQINYGLIYDHKKLAEEFYMIRSLQTNCSTLNVRTLTNKKQLNSNQFYSAFNYTTTCGRPPFNFFFLTEPVDASEPGYCFTFARWKI